jgi:hypothetical protein
MSRIDQITFGGEDASWLTNLNSDFINMVSFPLPSEFADE